MLPSGIRLWLEDRAVTTRLPTGVSTSLTVNAMAPVELSSGLVRFPRVWICGGALARALIETLLLPGFGSVMELPTRKELAIVPDAVGRMTMVTATLP